MFVCLTPLVAGLVLMALAASDSHAQKYPAKPLRIVTAEAGGGSDMVSRIIGQGLNASWGKAVVVDNRGGGVVAGRSSRARRLTATPCSITAARCGCCR